MDKKPQIIAEEIHLLKIETLKQKIDAIAFEKQPKRELTVGHKMMHNLDDERIKMEINLSVNGTNDKDTLLFFQIDFHFQVEHLDNFYQLNDEKLPIFWDMFEATLLGISFSTARGILFEKLQNAGLSNIIIPIVSPKKMLGE